MQMAIYFFLYQVKKYFTFILNSSCASVWDFYNCSNVCIDIFIQEIYKLKFR